MPCYHPIIGYRAQEKNKNGKRPIVFKLREGFCDMPVIIPCGQCVGCRLEKSRQWATRCVHEASLYSKNCFLTLTFNDDNLPKDRSVRIEHMQRFLHDLRQKFPNDKIRYFLCGEYGDEFQRPHYHVILFNFDFSDKVFWKRSAEFPLYTSSILSRLWPYGYSVIGDVSFESAAYVARYVMKKINGDKADEHYNGREPEFCSMSLRPGIGHDWIEKFFTDVYPHDYVVIRNGLKVLPPRYYDKYCEEYYPELFAEIKRNRSKICSDYIIDKDRAFIDYERLEKKEIYKMASIERLVRSYENL